MTPCLRNLGAYAGQSEFSCYKSKSTCSFSSMFIIRSYFHSIKSHAEDTPQATIPGGEGAVGSRPGSTKSIRQRVGARLGRRIRIAMAGSQRSAVGAAELHENQNSLDPSKSRRFIGHADQNGENKGCGIFSFIDEESSTSPLSGLAI